jgi:hypothetical protein
MLILILKRENIGVLAGFIWLSIWANTGCCEHSNELSYSIKCGEFFDQLSICLLRRTLFHGGGEMKCLFVT